MKIVGHRGARGLAPENTLASIKKALACKVDQVEVDLRVTKDKVVILHHGKYLRDRSGKKLKIVESTYADLKQHKADLTTLNETLAIIGSTPLYVEVKPGVNVKPIIKELDGVKNIFLGSKSQKTLLKLHDALPDIPKIVIEPWSGIRAHHRAKRLDTDLISMNRLWLWSGFIRAVSRSDVRLYAYTLNNPTKAQRWAKAGLYGVVTDRPDLFEK